jgi:hypothetical protein
MRFGRAVRQPGGEEAKPRPLADPSPEWSRNAGRRQVHAASTFRAEVSGSAACDAGRPAASRRRQGAFGLASDPRSALPPAIPQSPPASPRIVALISATDIGSPHTLVRLAAYPPDPGTGHRPLPRSVNRNGRKCHASPIPAVLRNPLCRSAGLPGSAVAGVARRGMEPVAFGSATGPGSLRPRPSGPGIEAPRTPGARGASAGGRPPRPGQGIHRIRSMPRRWTGCRPPSGSGACIGFVLRG